MSTLFLLLRIALYWVGGMISQFGFADFSSETGALTIDLQAVATVIAGVVITGGTFGLSRIAKQFGWAT